MTHEKTMINDLTQGSVTKQLLRFAAPFMLAQLLQAVYSVVDMIFIGNYVGSAGLSGVTIGTDLLMFFTFVGMGFANAGQVMISQFVGKGERDSISKMVGTMFTFILGISLVMTVICLALTNTMLHLLNTPEEAFPQAHAYLTVCFIGLFFIFGYNTVSAILRGMGDSKRPLLFIGIAAVMNLILDAVFVVGLQLSAMGAALATVIGQGFSFVVSLVYLFRRREAFGFDFKPSSFRLDPTKLKPLVKLGIPMILQSAAIAISFLFVSSFINAYGVTESAVTGVGMKFGNAMFVVQGSVATASAAMIGQNLGAGKVDRVKKIVRISHAICLSYSIVISILFMCFPRQVFGIFTNDEAVLAWARAYMDGVVARIGLSLLLGKALGMGVLGFWYGNALAGIMTALLAGIYYYSGRWKTRKLIVDS